MTATPSQEPSIALLREGDRQAFAQLVEAYSTPIYRMALRMLADPQDAEDVLQNTFLKAMQAITGFEGRSSLSTWLYRIAVNEALMLIRKRKPIASVPVDGEYDEDGEMSPPQELADWCCLPEQELLSTEARARLDQAIRDLPDGLRAVFLLRDIEGLSIRETGEALSLTETAVKTRLLRARLRLREYLSGYYSERMKETSA